MVNFLFEFYLKIALSILASGLGKLSMFPYKNGGGPYKGRFEVVADGGSTFNFMPSRSSWAEGQPGCWVGHLPGQW